MDSDKGNLETTKNNMINEVQGELSRMQKALNAQVRKHYITHNKFNSKSCYEIIDDINIRPLQDVVLLIVLAHGEQSKDSGQYPNIKFVGEDKRAFGDIMDLILIKRPAYLLSIVNSCNHIARRNNEGESIYDTFNNCNKQPGKPKPSAYQALFSPKSYSMAITFLSAQKGTATVVDDYGGIPFRAIMRALQYCASDTWVGHGVPDWSDVMIAAQTLNVCQTDERQECPYAELLKIEVTDDGIKQEGEGIFFCK